MVRVLSDYLHATQKTLDDTGVVRDVEKLVPAKFTKMKSIRMRYKRFIH